LLEVSDTELVLIAAFLGRKQLGKALEKDCLPVSDELGLEVVLAAEFSLTDGASQQIENDLRFELGAERTTSAWHEKVSWQGPVKDRLLVQRQGRTTVVDYFNEHVGAVSSYIFNGDMSHSGDELFERHIAQARKQGDAVGARDLGGRKDVQVCQVGQQVAARAVHAYDS
jgi:hypothetical protein